MRRKTKASPSAEETSLSTKTTPSAGFEEMDRWFEDVRRSFEERFRGPLGRGSETGLRVREPFADLIDTGSEFVVRAELPGMSREDIDLKVTAEGIEIHAEADRSREENEKNRIVRERAHEALYRTLRFPEDVKADRASATLKDGLLEVRIPKQESRPESKPVKVRVE